jgi:hypothetical protein
MPNQSSGKNRSGSSQSRQQQQSNPRSSSHGSSSGSGGRAVRPRHASRSVTTTPSREILPGDCLASDRNFA